MDHLEDLGMMALASRFKRLSDMCMSEVAAIYEGAGIPFDPSWYPLLTLLVDKPDITLTEAAQQLGLTHAAVSQKAASLARKKLLKLSPCADDKRSKRLTLTAEGEALLKQARPAWHGIRAAVQELVQQNAPNILHDLAAMEAYVRERRFSKTGLDALRQSRLDDVIIHSYTPELAHHFERLNRWWVEKYFRMEPIDERILCNPEEEVIAKGGEIYFAELDGEIVGTVGILKEGQDFELIKMGVAPEAQGRQVARKLLEYSVARARARGGRMLYLLSNDSLRAAKRLYGSAGFREVPMSAEDSGHYERCNYRMELLLEDAANAAA